MTPRSEAAKIGVLGGTFDPVHMGHLVIAEHATNALGLDSVLFIPAGRPWLKANTAVTEPGHRLAMVKLAVADNPSFCVSDIEVLRPGLTFTVDTLEQLRGELGAGVDLYLILGMDALNELPRWRNPGRLFDLCTIVGVSRPGHDLPDLDALDAIVPGGSRKVVLVDGPSVDISGTDLRNRVANHRPVTDQVPRAVESYILDRGLYVKPS